MSKKIHTIQSSDKKEFDKEVNFFFELGGELYDGGYEVIKNDDGVVYSQVVTFDTKKYDLEFHDNGKIYIWSCLNEAGKKDGKRCLWNENGNKTYETNFKYGKLADKSTGYYGKVFEYHNNGQIWREGHYTNLLDGKKDGEWTEYYENGQISFDRNFIDGKLDGKWILYHLSGEIEKERKYKRGRRIDDIF